MCKILYLHPIHVWTPVCYSVNNIFFLDFTDKYYSVYRTKLLSLWWVKLWVKNQNIIIITHLFHIPCFPTRSFFLWNQLPPYRVLLFLSILIHILCLWLSFPLSCASFPDSLTQWFSYVSLSISICISWKEFYVSRIKRIKFLAKYKWERNIIFIIFIEVAMIKYKEVYNIINFLINKSLFNFFWPH